MRWTAVTVSLVLAAPVAAQQQQPSGPPPRLAAQPVTDDYFGQTVEDRFRFVEKMEPATLAWMRAQADYTRRKLDSIAPRAALLERMGLFGGEFGFAYYPEYAGDRLFFLERAPGGEQNSLVVQEASGRRRTLVDVPALIKARGYPVAIDGFEPSRDGRFVALRLSEKGSENSLLTVVSVEDGRTIAGPVRLGPFTSTSWDEDGKSLFFTRLPDLDAADLALRYNNLEIVHWRFGSDPVVVAGAKAGLGPNRDPAMVPGIFTPRNTGRAIMMLSDGVTPELEAWEAPIQDAASGRARWRKIVERNDAVTGIFADRTGLYFLTHRDAPGYKVTQTTWSGTAAGAAPILLPDTELFYDTMRGGRDAIYVAGRERLKGVVWRIPRGGKPERLALPEQGSIQTLEAESDRDGAIVTVAGYATPSTTYRYVSGKGFVDLKLERRPPSLDLARYQVIEADAVARDGMKVPLIILTSAGPRRPRPFVIEAYGSYGINTLPLFSPRYLLGVDAGVGYASCSVRGGSELGDAWRLGGKDAAKPNTWRDAIACAETLIAEGYTTPRQLAIWGTSAGGITAGRAATERPDLFASVISAVGLSNPLRFETTAAGAANAKEFGSTKDPAGFRNLLAMDSYHAIRDGVKLPPFLVTGGMQDPRVVPWQPAKLVARLQEAGDTAFLRLEEEAGHGLGSTRSARDAEHADIYSFILWQAGDPKWQPR
ncbi:prolyl oligopeptidase [Sphingomonas metalli]|uniref:prolyl oligopeptidase n=1 Tax=Sphingomonas metalli TaxID=1779358 RepID=A0A916T6F7_9SPHN|nr:prolyl oligopeptidase family serine peptidase [Sphingomonas metalli]GGB33724.1 prolyl oligopeptidase [Sphingomonas metalli]